jgi:hypothetical protein
MMGEKFGILIWYNSNIFFEGTIMYDINEIKALGHKLLEMNPDPVPRFRILKDILSISPDYPDYIEAKKGMLDSKAYDIVASSQDPDGLWGQFHTQNTKIKTVFPTTEVALRRCLAIGLSKEDEVLGKLLDWIVACNNDEVKFPDRDEVTNSWMDIGVRWSTFGSIALIDPMHPSLDRAWEKWAHLVNGTFSSGQFNQDDHTKAFLRLAVNELTNRQMKLLSNMNFIGMRYCVEILGATANRLPKEIERAYVKWLLTRDEGIYYICGRHYDTAPDMDEREFLSWLNVHQVVSGFDSWQDYADKVLHDIRNYSGPDGLWQPTRGAKVLSRLKMHSMHQLSENWREPDNVKIDFSIRILSFLKKALPK